MKASRFSKYLCSIPASANMLKSSPKRWSMAPTLMQNSVATLSVLDWIIIPSWNSLIHASIFYRSRFFILSFNWSSLVSLWSGKPASPTILPLKMSSAALRTLSQSSGFILRMRSRYSSQCKSLPWHTVDLPRATTVPSKFLVTVGLKLNLLFSWPCETEITSLCLISSFYKSLYPLSTSA